MPDWINRTVGVAPRNATNNHVISFTAASSGNLLLVVMSGSVTNTMVTSGYTKRIAAVNNTELSVWTKTAGAGESSLSVNHNASNYPSQYAVYEFAAGSAWLAGSQQPNTNTWAALTGLTGTPTVFAAISQVQSAVVGATVLTTTTNAPWTEDYDNGVPYSGTEGANLSIAYQSAYASSSVTPSMAPTVGGPNTERGVWAITVVAPPSGSEVSSDLDARWRVRARITSDLDARWRVRNRVSSDLDVRWRVRSTTTSDLDARWAVRNRLTSDLDARWRVRSAVTSDLDARWRVRQQATSDADLRWRLRSVLTSDLDARWAVRSTLTSDLDLRWRLTGGVVSDTDLRWALRAAVSSDLDLRWVVDDGPGQVTSDADLRWRVRTRVVSTSDLRWRVLVVGRDVTVLAVLAERAGAVTTLAPQSRIITQLGAQNG